MEQKEQDSGFGQYKGFVKLLIKIIVPILLLVLLYLAYTPFTSDIEPKALPQGLETNDFWLLLVVALLCIMVLFLDCNRQFISRVASIIKKHWIRMLILFFLIVDGLAALIITFYIGPSFSIDVFLTRLSSSDEIVNFKSIALGLAGIIGIILAGWRSSVAERQARVSEERRLEEREAAKRDAERRFDERFIDAIKLLSQELNKTSYPAHLGAITALRDLAIDNNNYTQRCLDILCSCNQWMEDYLEKFIDTFSLYNYAYRRLTEDNRIAPNNSNVGLMHERRSQQVLNAVATIITKISKDDKKKHILAELDFSHKMLCCIPLIDLQIPQINFKKAYLNGAKMIIVNLQGADLRGTNLRGANIMLANLQGANLQNANLQNANLRNANLQGAKLSRSRMQESHLIQAKLQGANLHKVNLQGANLQSTNLSGALVLGCDFRGASMKDNNCSNVMFGEVSGIAQTEGAKEKAAILTEIHNTLNEQDENGNLDDKHKNAEPPTELDNLNKVSILETDSEGGWIIKECKIDILQDFYRELASKISEELKISKSTVVDSIIKPDRFYGGQEDDYKKIKNSLEKISAYLTKEFANKEE